MSIFSKDCSTLEYFKFDKLNTQRLTLKEFNKIIFKRSAKNKLNLLKKY
jgi:hypothetical protein